MNKLPLPPPADFLNLTFSAAIEWLLNQAIQLDEDGGAGFSSLDEKVVQLTLTDLKQTFFLILQEQDDKRTFTAQQHLMGAPDAAIKARLYDFINLKNRYQPEDFEMTGDQPLANAFLTALHQLEPDWEEHLSHFTGDLLAHQVGSAVRQVKRTTEEVGQQAKMTFKEFLQFEIHLVPTKHQVSAFNQEVDRIAERTQAIEQKIHSLIQSRAEQSK